MEKQKQIKRVTIVLKPSTIGQFSNILPNFVRWLETRKVKTYFPDYEHGRVKNIFKSKIEHINFISADKAYCDNDLIISLGGDGTLIGIIHKSSKISSPIFGVNMGRLGFITEFTKSEYYDELEKVLKGNYSINRFNLYKVTVKNKDKVYYKEYFLNEVVINKNDLSRMFTLTVKAGDQHIYDLSGDGLIISSPIGSTAYSLAAGGPIIHPNVNAVVLTPICAHALTHRPLVLSDKIELEVKPRYNEKSVQVTLDGQEVYNLKRGDYINVCRVTSKNIKLISNPNREYFHTLKTKFTYGKQEIL